MTKKQDINLTGQMFVRTRFSGVLISLPSEGAADVEGKIRYSGALLDEVMAWIKANPERAVPKSQYASTVSALASEVEERFGLFRPDAERLVDGLVRVSQE
jgi:hypothetical protein